LSTTLPPVSLVQPSLYASAPPARGKREVGKEFEAFVLQSFIQEMLPKEADSVFGKGAGADIWRSMLAEKLAYEVAARGDIGIAKAIVQDTGSAAAPDATVTPAKES